MNSDRITIKDVRSCNMCSKGARLFFEQHNLDWIDFLKNGVPISVIEETNDEMAMEIVEYVRRRK